jgi:hypothetical protein
MAVYLVAILFEKTTSFGVIILFLLFYKISLLNHN